MKHVCKWYTEYNFNLYVLEAKCRVEGCGALLSDAEIECRLNATERLSAEDALAGLVLGWVKGLRDKIRAYAAELEGK